MIPALPLNSITSITYDLTPIIIIHHPSAPSTTPATSLSNLLLSNSLSNTLQGQNSASFTNPGTGEVISLRGFGDNAIANIQTNYNNVSLNTSSLSGADLNLIDPTLLTHYSLDPNSGSSNNSVAGSANFFILPDSNLNSDTADFSISSGSYGTHLFSASGTHDFSQDQQIKIFAFSNQNNSNRVGDSTQITQLGLVFKTKQTQFFFQAGPEYDQYPGALTQNQVNQNRNQIGDYPGTFDLNNLLSSFSEHSFLTPNFSSDFLSSYLQQDGQGVWLSDNSDYTQNSETGTIQPSITWHSSDQKNQLTLSQNLSQSTYSHTDLNNAHEFDTNSGLSGLHVLNSHWQIKSGVNFITDHQTDNTANTQSQHSLWITDFQSLWQLNSHWDLTLARTGSYRLPLIDENSDTQPNLSLNPQSGIDYHATLNFKQNSQTTSLEIYQLNLQNEIAFVPALDQNSFGTNTNLPKTTRQGIILNNQNIFQPDWTLGESLSLLKNRLDDTNKTIPWTSPVLAQIKNIFTISSHWQWELDTNYTGQRYASSDNQNIGGEFGPTVLFNTTLSYLSQNWTANFSIQNLTNRHYYDYVIYSQNGDGFYPAEGVSGLLTIQLKLE